MWETIEYAMAESTVCVGVTEIVYGQSRGPDPDDEWDDEETVDDDREVDEP